MTETDMEVLVRMLGRITASVENPDAVMLGYNIDITQGTPLNAEMRYSPNGEQEFTVNIKLYNPTSAHRSGDSDASILPCDKCDMKGLRASDKNDNQDSIFHEVDCPYQVEKDDKHFALLLKAAESPDDESEGKLGHWENAPHSKITRRCWCWDLESN